MFGLVRAFGLALLLVGRIDGDAAIATAVAVRRARHKEKSHSALLVSPEQEPRRLGSMRDDRIQAPEKRVGPKRPCEPQCPVAWKRRRRSGWSLLPSIEDG